VARKSGTLKTQIIRSARRKKTVSARVVDGVLQIRAPAHLSDAELAPIIDQLKNRLKTRATRNQLDSELLERRARELNREYFDNKLTWTSIRWVTNQHKRAGSCTPSAGTIRISHHVDKMPAFVRDYVLVHEMAHLVEPNHSPRFWEMVNRYPKTERARGYLMAVKLELPSRS
jgi:predicted metal-dependent hydrolase